MSLNSRRQAGALTPPTRTRTLAIFIALGLTFAMAQAAALNPDQPIRLMDWNSSLG